MAPNFDRDLQLANAECTRLTAVVRQLESNDAVLRATIAQLRADHERDAQTIKVLGAPRKDRQVVGPDDAARCLESARVAADALAQVVTKLAWIAGD